MPMSLTLMAMFSFLSLFLMCGNRFGPLGFCDNMFGMAESEAYSTRRSNAVKKAAVVLIMFAAGGAFELLSSVLFSPWVDLMWRKPVSDWLVSLGFDRLAAYWSMVWVNLPEWCMAFLLGVLIGVLSKRYWFRNALVCGAGFILIPHILILVTLGWLPWAAFGFKVCLLMLFFDLVSIPVLLFTAWLFRRSRRKKEVGPALAAPA